MKNEVDCRVFLEQLDALVQGQTSEVEAARLRAHAGSCDECEMSLKLAEHLRIPARADLETQVPRELVEGMWPRLRAALAATRSGRGRQARRLGHRYVNVPILAAAAVILLLFGSTTYLLREVRALQQREQVLNRQVADQQRWMAELDLRISGDAAARTAGLAGRYGWERLLARNQPLNVAELRSMLAAMPSGATVLGAADVQRLLEVVPYLRAVLGESAAEGISLEDGLQAAEALQLLEARELDSSRRLSGVRLLGLLRSSSRQGRL